MAKNFQVSDHSIQVFDNAVLVDDRSIIRDVRKSWETRKRKKLTVAQNKLLEQIEIKITAQVRDWERHREESDKTLGYSTVPHKRIHYLDLDYKTPDKHRADLQALVDHGKIKIDESGEVYRIGVPDDFFSGPTCT